VAYQPVFSEESRTHLRMLNANQRSIVLEAIAQQLCFEPTVLARNRKLMRPNSLAGWELRIGNLRVFYNVFESSELVEVVAVGLKEGNRIFIAGEEVEL